jgi:hypothetical protein
MVIKNTEGRADEWILLPSTRNATNEKGKKWQEKYKFPSAIGAIHCTYVCII